MKVKIRGIYSTALTKLLKDKGFEICSPSEEISERFNFEEFGGSADVLIYDKEDLNGVTVNGNGCDRVVEVLFKSLPDVAIRRFETGTIYCGKIKRVEPKHRNIIVDLGGDKEGLLSFQDYWGYLREGEKLLVQVKGEKDKFYILSTKLRLFGESLVLIKQGFTKVSKHVKSRSERERLLRLSRDANLKQWGILWKALAEGKPDEKLRKEIEELLSSEEELKREFEQRRDPCLLKRGFEIYFIEFGRESKQRLDELRSKVIPTIAGHHSLKSGGYAELVDFADSLIGKLKEEEICKRLSQILRKLSPRLGEIYEIRSKKLAGEELRMRGKVEEIKDWIILKRRLAHGGSYDGIGKRIEEGDYAITKLREGSWYLIHEYHDRIGNLKGRYFSINTPLEVHPRFARCIDLEIDVVEVSGKRRMIDEEKLRREVERGIISSSLGERALEIAKQIVSQDE
jgi:Ribonuclease G/E